MKLICTGLLLVLFGACRTENVAESQSDSAAVNAALEQYRQSWLSGDTAQALRYIADDVRFMFPGIPDINGRADVRSLIVEEMATYRVQSLDIKRSDLLVRGDHAVDIGTYDEIQLPKTGAPIHGSGRYMTVWRRESGGWRIWRFMLTTLPETRSRP
jgi:ketosteroid isomerase-like protein